MLTGPTGSRPDKAVKWRRLYLGHAFSLELVSGNSSGDGT